MKNLILSCCFLLATFVSFGQNLNGAKGPGIPADTQWLGVTSSSGNLYRTGNVSIGSNFFDDGAISYKLSVNGKARAMSFKVYPGWADFVFEDNYELPSLAEVESHIATYGHLQDIPSAKTVAKEGIELGEMNKLLLQKVEELTLYVIDLNKKITALEQKQ